MRSSSSSGPIGKPQPARMAASTSSRDVEVLDHGLEDDVAAFEVVDVIGRLEATDDRVAVLVRQLPLLDLLGQRLGDAADDGVGSGLGAAQNGDFEPGRSGNLRQARA